MEAADIAIIAGFLVLYGLVSQQVERSVLTGPMIFVGFGLFVGREGFDVVDLPLDDAGVELLAEATLGLLLFSDAVRIDVQRLRTEFALPARMLGLGLPLVIALGTVLAAIVLDVPAVTAALIAAILAPTDAALGQAVVTSPKVPIRVRQSLNVESGLNDGIALPAVTVFIALSAREGEIDTTASWIRFAAEQIGYGAIVGIVIGGVGGFMIRWCSERSWMEGTFRQISVLGLAVTAFAVAEGVGGNGLIATFTAGTAFGLTARAVCAHVEEFTDDVAQLLAMVSFVVFGAIVVGPSLSELDWRVAVYAAASLLVVRPLAIAISLVGSGLRWPTVVFFGWFGPRGLASILFGLHAVSEGTEADLGPMFVVVSWTVLASIVAHGLSATPAAAAYGRWWDEESSQADAAGETEPMAEEMPMAAQRLRRERRHGP